MDSVTGPYAEAWEAYRRAGWPGVIPLPAGQKKPVPKGWTGAAGAWPSYADCAAWAEDRPAANIALRLNPGVLGVDVDAYGTKPGAQTLNNAVDRYGQLPATFYSSARGDGVSGIRFYRIPEGLAWPGEVGPGIETVHAGHRYAVVWPSIHPDTGTRYQWYDPAGQPIDGPPDVDQLPQLPDAWIQGLTGGVEAAPATPRLAWTSEQARSWLLARPRALQPACTRTARALADALLSLAAHASAHNTTTAAAMRIVRLADEGHAGAIGALTTLHDEFVRNTTNPARPGTVRTPGQAATEWAQLLDSAAAKVAATPTGLDACDCDGRLTNAIVDHAAAHTPQPDPTQPSAPNPTEPSQPDPPAPDLTNPAVEDQIRQETLKIHIREEARRRARRQQQGAQQAPPPVLLTTFLDIPDEPVQYRIEGLWPVGGRVMLTAQFKSGKTTLVGNLVRSLVDGDAFLERFLTHTPTGRVGIIDDELDERMLRRWLRDQNIRATDRAVVVPLRGKVSTFDLIDDDTRNQWAQTIQAAGITVLIVDCLAPILDALGLSEDKEAGQFLVALDETAKMAGVEEVLLVHHMGHNSERARGASRLRDWPDVEWRLVREKNKDEEDNPAAPRYFSAYGRDVDIAESALEYDPATRHLALTGGARKDAGSRETRDAIIAYLRKNPGASQDQVEKNAGPPQAKTRATLKALVKLGEITQVRAPRSRGLHHSVAPQAATSLGNTPTEPKPQVNGQSPESLGNARQRSAENSGPALGNPAPLRGGAGALPSSANTPADPASVDTDGSSAIIAAVQAERDANHRGTT